MLTIATMATYYTSGSSKKMSQDSSLRLICASRLKWLRDQEMFVSDAMNMGIEKGLEKGIEKETADTAEGGDDY